MIDDLLQDENQITIEKTNRMGQILLTFCSDNQPIGSLLLDPVEHKLLIELINESVTVWNAKLRAAKEKERRIRQNVRGSNKDDGLY